MSTLRTTADPQVIAELVRNGLALQGFSLDELVLQSVTTEFSRIAALASTFVDDSFPLSLDAVPAFIP